MNASTFTARVIASTGSDLLSAVVGAIGALKGPLHGGAPGPVLDMLDAIGAPAAAERWLARRARRRPPHHGHGPPRLPRARPARRPCWRRPAAPSRWPGDRLALARAVEARAPARCAPRGATPDRPLAANVEFYTAVLLDAVGLPATRSRPPSPSAAPPAGAPTSSSSAAPAASSAPPRTTPARAPPSPRQRAARRAPGSRAWLTRGGFEAVTVRSTSSSRNRSSSSMSDRDSPSAAASLSIRRPRIDHPKCERREAGVLQGAVLQATLEITAAPEELAHIDQITQLRSAEQRAQLVHEQLVRCVDEDRRLTQLDGSRRFCDRGGIGDEIDDHRS